ncbi:MAG TPA: adenylate/guanylate cyclase domain-containing protein [Vicinamibacterales bacterium]|nr:adenylate/guanylate cyclase domain-containing protein [Vicinamibacterales bacterium]
MFLLRYDDHGTERTHEVRTGVTLIGRLATCDLVIADSSVSRNHASLRAIDGRCFVQDAGSRFGTFVNDERVSDEVELLPGSRLKVGEVTLTLEQRVSEKELLSEGHEISEGPGTIYRPVTAVPPAAGDARLVRLLADMGRTLLGTQSLSEILQRVVDVTFDAVPAERAFLMLRDSADEGLTARVLRHRDGTVPTNATLSRQVVRRVMRERVAVLASDATTDPGLGVTDSILRFNIRAFMCAPLWSHDEVIGVLYVDSPRSARFGPADLDAFTALANAAAAAIEHARLSTQLIEEQRRRERLQRYHSPSVVSRILQAPAGDISMRVQERDVTVLFCDIVGFTSLCQQIPPAEAAALLTAFLTRMTDIVFEHQGTLDKFLGDALLAVFGAPFDQPDHAVQAVKASLAMRRGLADLNAQSEGVKLQMRIAISTGVALTGDFGSLRRREFTVLGDVVNTASRIEDEIAAPGEIVISGPTYAAVKDAVRVRPLGSRTLRGRAAPLDFFAVEELTGPS